MTKTHDLVVTHKMQASRELVWNAWTTADLMQHWWVGKGAQLITAQVRPEPGQSSLLGVTRADGVDEYVRLTYVVVEPTTLLEFVFDWVDADGNEIDPTTIGIPADVHRHVYHKLVFESTGATTSTITVEELGYKTEALAQGARDGLVGTLERINALISR